ncbi:2-succinyl-6-hydroxy-2,4-cyclohexadiene-1-carboxylate synthase [Candidatus Oscillochloris fontis]|uniref:2-succinyl-6-hydroxy-2, 4-cyclohexadiene-1-carboxylate synthase n=1 Tax=Candidatus Oscillochloris fontis TaxID=2496868 RepID=UPI00101CD184|nr:2-succinyl-6-hydroxy-2,4-cyclohexadiene-1-carboxylate synthase [Candidatus Oscillochloris fontis]
MYPLDSYGDGPVLVLLHGFTGSAEEWAEVIPHLTPYRRVIAVDLPGHGRASALTDRTMPRCVDDLLATLDDLGLAQIDLLGYSMGGRVALHLAAAAPQRIRSLILESASPGLSDPAERVARAAADDDLADQITSRGIAWFADYWQNIALFANQARLPAATRAALYARRLRCRPEGLAAALRNMGTGRQASLWNRLNTLPMRTLLISGMLDHKFTRINQQMVELMPNARHENMPDVGHAIHLEQPQAFAQLVVGFLTELNPNEAQQ